METRFSPTFVCKLTNENIAMPANGDSIACQRSTKQLQWPGRCQDTAVNDAPQLVRCFDGPISRASSFSYKFDIYAVAAQSVCWFHLISFGRYVSWLR